MMERKPTEDTTVVESDMETEKSIVLEVERRMSELLFCQQYSCKTCLSNFDYIKLQIKKYHGSVTQKLLNLGFLKIFQEVMRRYLNEKAATETDDKPLNARKPAMHITCCVVVDMTAVSSDTCREVIQLGLHINIIKSLKSGRLDPNLKNQSRSSALNDLVRYFMTVLHNVVQVITNARELFREQGIIEVIQRFRTGTSNVLSFQALSLLASVISDKDDSILNFNDDDFRFLSQELKSSLHEVPHRSKYGHKPVELLSVFNKLIVTDANKERFLKCGCLSSYVAFLDAQFDAEEQFLAAQGLCTIALKCSEEIKKEKFCVESKH